LTVGRWQLSAASLRRRGSGRALILRAIAEAKTLGIPNIEAQSWAFNLETHEVLRDVGFVSKTARFELKTSRE
jgi:GNAT superfamily N-acetyltransferase